MNGGEISALHRDSGTNEQIGTDAASGLVNVEGVNVLFAAHSSGVTIAIAESVTIPAGVLHLSVGSSSKAITALADNDMVFRTRVQRFRQKSSALKFGRGVGLQASLDDLHQQRLWSEFERIVCGEFRTRGR